MTTVVGVPPGVTASGYQPKVLPVIPVTTGLKWWMDAADPASFSYSSGVLVSQWRDKSGQNNHAVASGGQQPSRNGTRNGWPTVAIASGKGMAATPAVPVSSVTFEFSFFVVYIKTGANASFETPFTMTNGSAAAPMDAYNSYRSGPMNYPTPLNLQVQTTLCVWGLQEKRNTFPQLAGWVYEYRNGALHTSTTTADNTYWTTTGQKLMVGSRNDYATSLVGEIGEIALYDRYLPDPERQQVESYLRTKWGTP